MKSSNVRPVLGRVVVLPDPAPEKTSSGLIIPEAAKTPPSSGTIVSVNSEEPIFRIGDRVLFVANAGVELETSPVTFIMPVEDIYATI